MLYTCAFLCYLPKLIYQAIFLKKYRLSFFKRIGFGFPKIERKGDAPLIWIHAVSVGETQAIAGFVKKLKRELVKESVIVFSSITETGHATAKRLLPEVDYHLFLPFDFFFSVRRAIRKTVPDLVIVSELDLWWRFLDTAKKNGAHVLVASGKLSDSSFKAFNRFKVFSKRLFSTVDFYCMQSDAYREKLLRLGVPPEKIEVTGNMKADFQIPAASSQEKELFRKKLGFSQEDFVLVIGSTHEPEEEMILKALDPLLQSIPALKIVLVPRHPERFSHVKAIVGAKPYRWSAFSTIKDTDSTKIVVVDAMGVLIQCYQIANAAIVAGSFVEHVGGHNILEPCFFGVPTLCGPFMHTQKQLIDVALEYKAVLQVDENSLQRVVKELIEQKEKQEELSKNGRLLCEKLRGATQRTIEATRFLVPRIFA